jgi:hypothetical protein
MEPSSSMPEHIGPHGSPPPRARRHAPIFDDASPQLDRFGSVLALAFVTVTLMSLVDLRGGAGGGWRAVATSSVVVLIGATLLLALRASGVSRRWRAGIEISLGITVALSVLLLVVQLTTDISAPGLSGDRPAVVWVAIAVLTPIAIIRRLLQHRRVTTGTLLGAIAAYLLVALAFCYAMLFVSDLQGGFFVGEPDASTTTFMYFSIVSLTTVGYGDVAAATDLGRYIAALESLVGQVYLVTFVAMLVGLWIQGRSQER